MVTDHFSALLESFRTTYIQTYRCIEFQCTSTSCGLRISEHHADLLTKLIDKDHDTVSLADNRCELSQCLRHKSRLQSHMRITHIAFDLCLWNQRCHRVHDHNIHCSRTHHGLSDLQCLFPIVRLGNVKIINIHTNISCIDRIKRMLCINKSRNASTLLYLSYHMKSNRGLTTGFRSVDLNNSSLRNTSCSQCNIKA